ncbi:MAG TPA: putative ABC transporter permease [Bacilli bacterium]|nr:putative ABC transporter permease [Bacilli bacterium]
MYNIYGCDYMQDIYTYFMLFTIYSILGWIIELVDLSILEKKLIKNRGFFIGPYCPIYGFGALIMTLFLTKYENDPVVLFFMAIIVTSILEYFTSVILEKVFNARWWDYSNMPFNINGRVLLINSLGFGFFGLILIYYFNPFLLNIFSKINYNIFQIISIILFIMFLLDAILSITIMFKIKANTKLFKGDNTYILSSKVKEELKKFGKLKKRLLNAFPHINILDNNPLKKIKIFLEKNFKK